MQFAQILIMQGDRMPLPLGFTQRKNGCKNHPGGGGGCCFMFFIKLTMKSECPLVGQKKYYVL
jgi:hypothetical protein